MALKELVDACYLLYDYATKCEKCCFVAYSLKKNGNTKIIYYVDYEEVPVEEG